MRESAIILLYASVRIIQSAYFAAMVGLEGLIVSGITTSMLLKIDGSDPVRRIAAVVRPELTVVLIVILAAFILTYRLLIVLRRYLVKEYMKEQRNHAA